METLNKKLIRLNNTLERFRDLWKQTKIYQTPGKRQALMRSLQDTSKNLMYQMSSIKEHISGTLYIITYQEKDKKYQISFTNCTKEEAIVLAKAFSYSHEPEILEIKEIIASSEPIKL